MILNQAAFERNFKQDSLKSNEIETSRLSARQRILANGQENWSRARNLSEALRLFHDDLTLEEMNSLSAVYFKDRYDIDLDIPTRVPESFSQSVESLTSSDTGRLRERLVAWDAVLANFNKDFLRKNPYLGSIQVFKSGRASHGNFENSYTRRAAMRLFIDNDELTLFHEMGHAIDPMLILRRFTDVNIYSNVEASRLAQFAQKYGYEFDINKWEVGNRKEKVRQLSDLLTQIYKRKRDAWADLFRNENFYDAQQAETGKGLWESYLDELRKKRESLFKTVETISPLFARHRIAWVQEILDKEISDITNALASGELSQNLKPEDERYLMQRDKRNKNIRSNIYVMQALFDGIEKNKALTEADFLAAKVNFHHFWYIFNVPETDNQAYEDDKTVEGARLRSDHAEFFAEYFRWFISEGQKFSYYSEIIEDLDPEMSSLMNILIDKTVNHSYRREIRKPQTDLIGKQRDGAITGGSDKESLVNAQKNGGIDLNPTILNTEIKRTGRGVIIPVQKGEMPQLNGVEGFVPTIINITPITNLPLFLGISNVNPSEKPAEVSYQTTH